METACFATYDTACRVKCYRFQNAGTIRWIGASVCELFRSRNSRVRIHALMSGARENFVEHMYNSLY